MIRIAVCDDDPFWLNRINQILQRYAQERNIQIQSCFFNLPAELLDQLEAGDRFDLYLLDIYMPGLTGMGVASYLRKTDMESPVIFLTTSTEHALEAFGVGAMQYLVKPFETEALFLSLDKAIREIQAVSCKRLGVKVQNEYRTLDAENIIYCETNGHYQNIILLNGEVVSTRLKVAELSEKLVPLGGFYQCGKAYILALSKISRITAASVFVSGGRELSVPKSALAGLRMAYFDYYERG